MSSPFLNKEIKERNARTMGKGIIIGNDAYRIKQLEKRIAELETIQSQIPYNISYDAANEEVSLSAASTTNES